MPDMLRMTACQVGHPVSLFILVEGDDRTIQLATSWGVCPAASVIDAWYLLLYMPQMSDFPWRHLLLDRAWARALHCRLLPCVRGYVSTGFMNWLGVSARGPSSLP